MQQSFKKNHHKSDNTTKKIGDITLSKKDIAILREVSNIGAGQSSIFLGNLIKQRIELLPEDIKIIDKDDLYTAIGSPKFGVFGVYMGLYNELNGDSMILFKSQSLLKILDLIHSKKLGTTSHVKASINKQIIKSLGEKALVPYIRSLGDLLGLDIKYTVPIPIYEHTKNLLGFIERGADKTLMIKANLRIETLDTDDDVIVIIQPKDINKIIEILKEKAGY